MSTRQNAIALDVCAVSLSALCLVHCLAIPLLVVFLPVSAMWLENEWLHRGLVLFALPVSGLAIYSSVAGEERTLFPFVAAAGLILLTAAAFVEALHDFETILTVAGALLLAFAHITRWVRAHRHGIDGSGYRKR